MLFLLVDLFTNVLEGKYFQRVRTDWYRGKKVKIDMNI